MAETERLFFALWPEPQQQHDWADLARGLIPQGCGRLVPAQNLHLTVLYLGEVLPQQRQLMEEVAAAIKLDSFILNLEGLGYWRKPQVLWLGVRETPQALASLVQLLRQGAVDCGIKLDQRPYKPHLTLARKVGREPERLDFPPREWRVGQFVLVRSHLTPAGAEYEVVQRWLLRE